MDGYDGYGGGGRVGGSSAGGFAPASAVCTPTPTSPFTIAHGARVGCWFPWDYS
jgi:hypothetical protein